MASPVYRDCQNWRVECFAMRKKSGTGFACEALNFSNKPCCFLRLLRVSNASSDLALVAPRTSVKSPRVNNVYEVLLLRLMNYE
jgi:hypothetical protein